jgi:hypothetical protein
MASGIVAMAASSPAGAPPSIWHSAASIAIVLCSVRRKHPKLDDLLFLHKWEVVGVGVSEPHERYRECSGAISKLWVMRCRAG